MRSEMTMIVMPNHTNHLGTCFGGTIMSWIDIVAAIAAQKLVGTVVTASVDQIQFKRPIRVGDLVTLKAGVNRVWNTSMEVGVNVSVQSPEVRTDKNGEKYTDWGMEFHACTAYLTFVAINQNGQRRSVSESDNQVYNKAIVDIKWENRWHSADDRRERRLEERNK